MLIAKYKKETKNNTQYDSKRKFISIPLVACVICAVLSIVGYIYSSSYAIRASDDLAELSKICEDTYKEADDAEHLVKLCTEVQMNKIETHYINEKNSFREIAIITLSMTAILVILSLVLLSPEKPKE